MSSLDLLHTLWLARRALQPNGPNGLGAGGAPLTLLTRPERPPRAVPADEARAETVNFMGDGAGVESAIRGSAWQAVRLPSSPLRLPAQPLTSTEAELSRRLTRRSSCLFWLSCDGPGGPAVNVAAPKRYGWTIPALCSHPRGRDDRTGRASDPPRLVARPSSRRCPLVELCQSSAPEDGPLLYGEACRRCALSRSDCKSAIRDPPRLKRWIQQNPTAVPAIPFNDRRTRPTARCPWSSVSSSLSLMRTSPIGINNVARVPPSNLPK